MLGIKCFGSLISCLLTDLFTEITVNEGGREGGPGLIFPSTNVTVSPIRRALRIFPSVMQHRVYGVVILASGFPKMKTTGVVLANQKALHHFIRMYIMSVCCTAKQRNSALDSTTPSAAGVYQDNIGTLSMIELSQYLG